MRSDYEAAPRRRRSVTVRAGVAIAAAALLGACGSSGASATAARSGKSSSATGLLAKIESSHKLSIAMSAFAPQDFQAANGSWTGYDVGILKGFAHTLRAHLVVDSMPFASSVEAVATQRDDVTIDIFYTAARAKVISFTRPMLNYNDAVAVNASSPQVKSATLSALSGKKIAVVTGSEEVGEAQKIPNATVTQYSSIADAFLAVSQGRVAADLQPAVDISWAKHKNPSLNIKILGPLPASIAPPIASLRGYYGVPKKADASQFLAKLNSYLKTIACNGTEQKILDEYGMSNPIYLKGICTAPNTYSGAA